MLQIKLEEILDILKDEKEFFLDFENDFTDIFSKNIESIKPGLLSITSLKTFGIKLYFLLFSFQKDPTQELYNFSKKLAEFEINLKPIITKSLLNIIGGFAIYLSEKEESIEKLKYLITLVDSYLSTVDRAYIEYYETIEKELKEKKEREREIFLSLFEKIKKSDEEIDIVDFYKELPIVFKSRILKIYSNKIIISVKGGKYDYLKKREVIYLKSYLFPKPIKSKIFDLDIKNENIILCNFSFEDIKQDKRKNVRVELKEKISIKIEYRGKIFNGFIKDISVGGVGVILSSFKDMKNGEKVDLKFELLEKEIHTKAKIAHINRKNNLILIGLNYSDFIDLKTEEYISSFVISREFEILKELKRR